MKKFKISFYHEVTQFYTTVVEAETLQDAEDMFYDDPYEAGSEPDLINEEGTNIDIIEITEIKE